MITTAMALQCFFITAARAEVLATLRFKVSCEQLTILLDTIGLLVAVCYLMLAHISELPLSTVYSKKSFTKFDNADWPLLLAVLPVARMV